MSKLQQGALTMKAAGCIALATGVIGLSHVDTYLESILIGKSHPPGMDLLSALGLIFVGVSVFANLYSKKLFLVRTAILSILLGMMSAFTYQSQVAQSIEDGAGTHRVLDGIWMHSSSPLGGFSVTLTAFCFYLYTRFESENRLLSNLLFGFIVSLINIIAMIGSLIGIESFSSVSIFSSFCFSMIGIEIIVMARQKIKLDPRETNFFQILLFCILFGRQKVQEQLYSVPPFFRMISFR